MALTQGLGLTETAWREILALLRRVKYLPALKMRDGRPSRDQTPASQATPVDIWVKITSTTQTSGRYPGHWSFFGANTLSWNDDPDSNSAWVIAANNAALSTGKYYRASSLDGVAATGVPVFLVGCCDQGAGGQEVTALTAPSAPTVTPTGTTGATSYGYKVTALSATGETLASSEGTTATANATLDATNYNAVTWTPAPGATSYKVYRTTAAGTPNTTGLIGTVQASSYPAGSTPTLNDTGLSASGSVPTADTSGNLQVDGWPVFAKAGTAPSGMLAASQYTLEYSDAAGAPVLTISGQDSGGSAFTAAIDLDGGTYSGGSSGSGGKDVDYFRQVGTSPLELRYSTAITQNTLGIVGLSSATFYAVPFTSPRSGTIDRIGVNVTSAAAAGKKARLGIYSATSATNLYPSAKVLDSGEIAIDATGAVEATVSQALTAGTLYWLVILADAAISVKAVQPSSCSPILGFESTYTTPQTQISVAQAYGALPSTFTGSGTTNGNNAPLIGVRYSA